MTTNNSLSNQLIETFSEELESLLITISEHLKQIVNSKSANLVTPMIEEISRAGRNIKVAAFSLGIDDIGKMAECIEKLFVPTRQLSPELINLTSRVPDIMREAMRYFIEKKPVSDNFQFIFQKLKNQLVFYKEKEERQNIKSSSPENIRFYNSSNIGDEEVPTKIIETFKAELQDNLTTITDSLLQLEKGTKSTEDLQEILEEIFRMAHNIKGSARGIGAVDVGEIAHYLETLLASVQKKITPLSHEMINLCLQAIDYMNKAMQCYCDKTSLPFDLNSFLSQLSHYTESGHLLLAQSTIKKSMEDQRTNTLSEIQTKTNEFESIRVSLQNLDRISVYMEELQMIKIAIEEYYSKLIQLNFKIEYLAQYRKKDVFSLIKSSDNKLEHLNDLLSSYNKELNEINNETRLMQRELRKPVSEFSILLNGLQDEVRTIRLVPVSTQLRYLLRNARDLALELDKEVNLEIKSNHVKMDKIILDGLKDPIIHILRNAIDHGIESKDVRLEAGKSPEGNILVEANQEDNQIIFKISDDGAGVNTDALIRVALQKKIITQAELATMKQEDIYELMFRPGFSTREVATDISGRGIGLDVVRSNIHHLKGQVHLESHPGKGTTFFLHVPLTLATERGLIISCSNQVFAISTSFIESVLLLKKQDIVTVEGGPALLIKEQPVLLCSLSKILELEEKNTNKEYFSVIVMKQNEKRIAFFVDDIIGEREIVLKPLQEPLSNISCIIGATLTGSNQINFVLNASDIFKRVPLKAIH